MYLVLRDDLGKPNQQYLPLTGTDPETSSNFLMCVRQMDEASIDATALPQEGASISLDMADRTEEDSPDAGARAARSLATESGAGTDTRATDTSSITKSERPLEESDPRKPSPIPPSTDFTPDDDNNRDPSFLDPNKTFDNFDPPPFNTTLIGPPMTINWTTPY